MEIKIENAKAALKTADESVKKVLLALLPELKETEAQTAANRPIIERVKTFEDACRDGRRPPLCSRLSEHKSA